MFLGKHTPAPYPGAITYPEDTMASTAGAVSTTYAVSGMSCGHCKATLTRVIGELDGVTSVDVQVAAGRVTVTGTAEPDDAVIAEAVDEAGYELTGRL